MKNKGFISDTLMFTLFTLLARLISLLTMTVVVLIVRFANLNAVEHILSGIFGVFTSALVFFILLYRYGKKPKTDKQTIAGLLLPLILSQLIYFVVCIIFKYSAILSGSIVFITQSIENNTDIYPAIYKDYLSSFLISTVILSAIEILSAACGYMLGAKKGKKDKDILHKYSDKAIHQ